MKLRKFIYLSTAVLAFLTAGGTAVSANASHRPAKTSVTRNIHRCAYVSPRNRQIYNTPNRIVNDLQYKQFRIYNSRYTKPKGADVIAQPNPSKSYSNYLDGEYDLTSQPGHHYGKLITDRAGTYRLTRSRVPFRDLKQRFIDNDYYELLESRAPHYVGWINQDGAFNYSKPFANGPFTIKQLKRDMPAIRAMNHSHRTYRHARRHFRHFHRYAKRTVKRNAKRAKHMKRTRRTKRTHAKRNHKTHYVSLSSLL